MATNGNVTESDDAIFDLCITLTDVGSGLERDVSFEIRQQYSGYNKARSRCLLDGGVMQCRIQSNEVT